VLLIFFQSSFNLFFLLFEFYYYIAADSGIKKILCHQSFLSGKINGYDSVGKLNVVCSNSLCFFSRWYVICANP